MKSAFRKFCQFRKFCFLSLAILPSLAAQSPLPEIPKIPEHGVLLIDTAKLPKEPPLFFRAESRTTVTASETEAISQMDFKLFILQGKAESVRIALTGIAPIRDVKGPAILAWAERTAENGARFLEIELRSDAQGGYPKETNFTATAAIKRSELPADFVVTLPGQGDAVAFSSTITLRDGGNAEWRVRGLTNLDRLRQSPTGEQRFQGTGQPRIEARLVDSGAQPPAAELRGAQLVGTADEKAGLVAFILTGTAHITEAGARLPILSGAAAMSAPWEGAGWRVELESSPAPEAKSTDQQSKTNTAAAPRLTMVVVFDQPGTFPLRLPFEARIDKTTGWNALEFSSPAGTIVPVTITQLSGPVEFRPESIVQPKAADQGWIGYLPAEGACDIAWRSAREVGDGQLFVNSTARIDVAVGSGLIRQTSDFALRVLQGKLTQLSFLGAGDGEVVEVTGTNVAGWSVSDADGIRRVSIALSRPVESDARYTIRSQTALGAFPSRAVPLRLTPEAAGVRHSGMIRLRNDGAVRFEPMNLEGLMQLAPAQWTQADGSPTKNDPASRQVAVYRFPLADYSLELEARQVLPEVNVNQIVTYEVAESDRLISADLELDVREAPLREWTLQIPDGYAVASATGAEVADAIPGELANGQRALRVLFQRPVEGRVLIKLKLEKNEAAAAGDWALPPLQFPDAKSVRGFVGVKAAPGYRIAPREVKGIVETPLSYFPNQGRGLQQAFRIREAMWSGNVRIEPLAQSVTADLFHLYSLREGVAYGSVVMNFFVVGAPVNEWKIEVPEDAGNLSIDGQEVRSWRRDGSTVLVSLNRPALGSATLLATFEHPMSARGGKLKLGTIQPLNVESERGFVQVVSPLQVQSKIAQASENLLKLEAGELPPELRLLTSAPSLAVFQYASRPFTLEMNVEWFQQAETVPQVVDFAKLDTRVSRDGQIVTDARYFVKIRGLGMLRLTLPSGAKLWEARVDGAIVNARTEGDDTLVPLPSNPDSDRAAEVSLRFGWTDNWPSRVLLAAPTVTPPVMITEWKASADRGRVLLPSRNTSMNPDRVVTETGFEWLAKPSRKILTLILLAGTAAAMACASFGRRRTSLRVVGALILAGLLLACAGGALDALTSRRVNVGTLDLVVPVTAATQPVEIGAWNLPTWLAMISIPGTFLLCFGALLFVGRKIGPLRDLPGVGLVAWLCFGIGLLMQHGGAAPFLAFVGLSLLLLLAGRLFQGVPRTTPPAVPATLALLLFLAASPFAAHSEPVDSRQAPLQMLEQTIRIDKTRATVTARVMISGQPGESFVLLRAPAILTSFQGEGLRVAKVGEGAESHYTIAPERAGRLTGTLSYEFPVPETAAMLTIPTGPSVGERIDIERNEAGWGFTSAQAVRAETKENLEGTRSGAVLTFLPAERRTIRMAPKPRDAKTEQKVFYVESANLFVPAPGVVDGVHQVRVRVSQGELTDMKLWIPKGFMVGSVSGGVFQDTASDWKFDPASGALDLTLPSPQRGEFAFQINTQSAADRLPTSLDLAPVRVEGPAGELGTLGLAFGPDAQPEQLQPKGLTQINLDDFSISLPSGETAPVLHRVFRYGTEAAALTVKVGEVAPEIRITTQQVLSLGDERTLLSVDLTADIRRAGVFRLVFTLPANLEPESISGPALSHWTEVNEGGQRKIVLNLTGRTVGEQKFSIALTGPPAAAGDAWVVPAFRVDDAARSAGTLLISPEKGLRIRTVDRESVSQIDARDAGNIQPGTLAFRLLQADWKLTIGIERLEPWITARLLHEIRVREGQARHRIAVRYRIENASVKQLRIELPGIDAEAARSVRASGEAVADIVRQEGTDVWEIRFQRGILGEVPVQIEYAERLPSDNAPLPIHAPKLPEVKQSNAFAALYASGRLELGIGTAPAGWQKVDWNSVPAELHDERESAVPQFALRVAEPEGALSATIKRQEMADALKLRVEHGEFATVFSPRGDSVTAAHLRVRVNEKSTMSIRLPKSSLLFQVSVNGEDVPVVANGDSLLFYVMPPAEPNDPAEVDFVYAVPGGKRVRSDVALATPSLNVPLENVEWKVVVPAGWALDDYKGSLTLRKTGFLSSFSVDDYLSASVSRKQAKVKSTNELMSKADQWLKQGEQEKARVALNKAAKTTGIDEATTEDARVQLRNLYNQQAVLGLNTRRQKLYLDNRSLDSAAYNEQLEQAARANGFIQGEQSVNIQQVDKLLEGNTIEETTALKRVADRIVSQQIAAEPAPRTVGPTLPERGTEYSFTRSVQVEGSKPLTLEIDINRTTAGAGAFSLLVLVGLVALGACGALLRASEA